MNRAVDRNWKQDGIYMFCTPDISNPSSYTKPVRILSEAGWYPQVIGSDRSKQETDRVAGASARLFIHGESKYHLHFSRTDP